jgi:hypothetical protein
MDAKGRLRIINDSVKIVQTSDNAETVLSRFDLIMEHARELYKYEQKGITTINPPPSEYLKDQVTDRDKYLLAALDREVKKTAGALLDLKTPKAKATRITKLVERVNGFKAQLTDASGIAAIEKKITKLQKQVEAE